MTGMNKKHQINLWYALIAFGVLMMFQSWYATWKTVEPIPYSQFEQLLKDGKVAATKVGAMPKSKIVEWLNEAV